MNTTTSAKPKIPMEIEAKLDSNLKLVLTHTESGKTLSSDEKKLFHQKYSEAIEAFLDESAQRRAREIGGVEDVHTSSVVWDPKAADRALRVPSLPERPAVPAFLGLPQGRPVIGRKSTKLIGKRLRQHRSELGSWFSEWRDTVDEIEEGWASYSRARAEASRFRESARARLATDRKYLVKVLAARFKDLPWRPDTNFALDTDNNEQALALSVNLPGLAELPSKTVERARDAEKLQWVELTDQRRSEMHRRFTLSAAAATIVVVFETAPHLRDIKILGYSREPGELVDRTIFRIDIDRITYDWEVGALLKGDDLEEMADRRWCRLSSPSQRWRAP